MMLNIDQAMRIKSDFEYLIGKPYLPYEQIPQINPLEEDIMWEIF
jgi:hypothetical protein